MNSAEWNVVSIGARRDGTDARRVQTHEHDELLALAEHHTSLTEVQGDSYAELLISWPRAAAATAGLTPQVVDLRFDAPFEGIAS